MRGPLWQLLEQLGGSMVADGHPHGIGDHRPHVLPQEDIAIREVVRPAYRIGRMRGPGERSRHQVRVDGLPDHCGEVLPWEVERTTLITEERSPGTEHGDQIHVVARSVAVNDRWAKDGKTPRAPSLAIPEVVLLREVEIGMRPPGIALP